MQSLAETVFERIRGEDRTAYSEEVCDYLNSREFLEENQGMYLKRSGASARPHAARTSTCLTATGDSQREDWSSTTLTSSSDGTTSRTEAGRSEGPAS